MWWWLGLALAGEPVDLLAEEDEAPKPLGEHVDQATFDRLRGHWKGNEGAGAETVPAELMIEAWGGEVHAALWVPDRATAPLGVLRQVGGQLLLIDPAVPNKAACLYLEGGGSEPLRGAWAKWVVERSTCGAAKLPLSLVRQDVGPAIDPGTVSGTFRWGPSSATLADPALVATLVQQGRLLPASHVLVLTSHAYAYESTDPTALAQRRAEAVRDALVKGGVPAWKIVVDNVADRTPIAPLHTPDGQAANRRLDVSTRLRSHPG